MFYIDYKENSLTVRIKYNFIHHEELCVKNLKKFYKYSHKISNVLQMESYIDKLNSKILYKAKTSLYDINIASYDIVEYSIYEKKISKSYVYNIVDKYTDVFDYILSVGTHKYKKYHVLYDENIVRHFSIYKAYNKMILHKSNIIDFIKDMNLYSFDHTLYIYEMTIFLNFPSMNKTYKFIRNCKNYRYLKSVPYCNYEYKELLKKYKKVKYVKKRYIKTLIKMN